MGVPIPINQKELTAEAFQRDSKKPSVSSKPFWIFLLFVIGIPWLIAKLIKLLDSKKLESDAGIHPSQLDFAKALFDFVPENPQELRLSKGQVVAILEKSDNGWWKGRNQAGEIGYFPGNRVEIIERRTPTPAASSSIPIQNSSNPIADSSVLLQKETQNI